MAKKFGYKKYLKPKKQQKDMSTLKIFVVSFVLMLVVFTVLINCFAPEVDVSIGDTVNETAEQEKEIYLKKYVDDRLLAIQQEDLGQDIKQQKEVSVDKPKEEQKTLAPVVLEIEEKPIQVAVEPAQPVVPVTEPEVVNLPAPQPIEPQISTTYRVYIGYYNTYDQVKVAKDIVNETDSNINAVIKELSNGYTLQAGVFKSKDAALSFTNDLLKEHLPARMVID